MPNDRLDNFFEDLISKYKNLDKETKMTFKRMYEPVFLGKDVDEKVEAAYFRLWYSLKPAKEDFIKSAGSDQFSRLVFTLSFSDNLDSIDEEDKESLGLGIVFASIRKDDNDEKRLISYLKYYSNNEFFKKCKILFKNKDICVNKKILKEVYYWGSRVKTSLLNAYYLELDKKGII